MQTISSYEPDIVDWKTFYFSYKGRTNRFDYFFKWCIPYWIILLVCSYLDYQFKIFIEFNNNNFGILSNTLPFLLIWSSTVILIKRLHDFNVSGWVLLVFFGVLATLTVGAFVIALFGLLPLIAIIFIVFIITLIGLIITFTLPGTKAENKYGSPQQFKIKKHKNTE